MILRRLVLATILALGTGQVAASAGGEITIYTSLTPKLMEPIAKEFEKMYPGTKVHYLKLSPLPLLSRILLEQKAGLYKLDVVMDGGAEMNQLNKLSAFERYESPEAKNYSGQAKDQSGYWTTVYANELGLIYNPITSAGLPLPKNWEDLAKPIYKDRLLIPENEIDIYAGLKEIYGDDKAKALLKGILKNAGQVASAAAVAEMIVAGEAPLGIGFPSLAETMPGAPIAFSKDFGPTVIRRSLVALAKNAPNKELAQKFIDFALSHAVQKFLVDAGRASMHKDLAPARRMSVLRFPTEDEYREMLNDWKKFSGA
ncbi:MAG: extracellular solute-binding protein [Parcubacteria group bacterium]|nr:extracellular solute-binding protein [Parcubacteria group bacterium]